MISNPGPGKFLVLEGLDGAGTTTQTRFLADSLREHNILQVWTTREPSEGPIGAQIRAVLTRRLNMPKNVLTALFAADRLDHLYSQGGVLERLRRGQWVIIDRYYHSSFAYQALDMTHEEKAWLMTLHQPCIQPDITFFVDVSAETSMTRITLKRGFHYELFEKLDKLVQIREQYFKAIDGLRRTGEVIHVISGEQTIENVRRNIWERVEKRLLSKAFLPLEEEQKVWIFSGLKRIRQHAEDKIKLTYLGTKYTPPSYDPKNPMKGNAGGAYQLIFFDDDAIEYRVVAWLNGRRDRITTIKAQTSASGREKNEELNRICQSAFRNQPQLEFRQ
jgi:dTMP kinase